MKAEFLSIYFLTCNCLVKIIIGQLLGVLISWLFCLSLIDIIYRGIIFKPIMDMILFLSTQVIQTNGILKMLMIWNLFYLCTNSQKYWRGQVFRDACLLIGTPLFLCRVFGSSVSSPSDSTFLLTCTKQYQMMTWVFGSRLPVWETWIEFQVLGLSLAQT